MCTNDHGVFGSTHMCVCVCGEERGEGGGLSRVSNHGSPDHEIGRPNPFRDGAPDVGALLRPVLDFVSRLGLGVRHPNVLVCPALPSTTLLVRVLSMDGKGQKRKQKKFLSHERHCRPTYQSEQYEGGDVEIKKRFSNQKRPKSSQVLFS